MKLRYLLPAAAAAALLGSPLALADTVVATDGADLAAKITAANSDSSITVIRCATAKGCDLTGTLPTYTGSQRLVINGRGSTIDATATATDDVFSAIGGGKVKLVALKLLGGMSGVYVEVPGGLTKTQSVELLRVVVRGAALHGVHIVDDDGAKASVRLLMTKTKVLENGFGDAEQGGVLILETGAGKALVEVTDSTVKDNAGDGFNVEEQGAGDVKMTVAGSAFLSNGTNPGNSGNPEDGLDVNESAGGSIFLTVSDSRFNLNRDDGMDVDEAGGGNITIDATTTFANKNKDQGVAFTERLAGDATVTLTDSKVTGNDANSQKINIRGEQLDSGVGDLTLVNTTSGKISVTGVTVTKLP